MRFWQIFGTINFLSPEGAEETSLVVKGLDLSASKVLDIGCGYGAIAVLLVEELGADCFIGIDVEETVCSVDSIIPVPKHLNCFQLNHRK